MNVLYRTMNRRIIEFGFVTGALFCVPTSYVLYSTWDSTHTCNTSLRMWLLLRLFVFFAQVTRIVYHLDEQSTNAISLYLCCDLI